MFFTLFTHIWCLACVNFVALDWQHAFQNWILKFPLYWSWVIQVKLMLEQLLCCWALNDCRVFQHTLSLGFGSASFSSAASSSSDTLSTSSEVLLLNAASSLFKRFPLIRKRPFSSCKCKRTVDVKYVKMCSVKLWILHSYW